MKQILIDILGDHIEFSTMVDEEGNEFLYYSDSDKAELVYKAGDHIEYNTVVDEEGNEFMYYRWYDVDGNLKEASLEEIKSDDEWLDQVLR